MSDTVTFDEVLSQIDTSENPVAGVIISKLSEQCTRLAEISSQVGSTTTDPNAPKKPTIGVVIKEAGEVAKVDDDGNLVNADADPEVVNAYNAYITSRNEAKRNYRILFAALHPEFDLGEEGDVDDSEKDALVAEAKDTWKSVKSGVDYLSTLDGITDEFVKDFLNSVPQVQGARMITTVAGEVKRPKFDSITITLGESVWSAKTLTEAATTISKNGGKGTSAGDLGEAYFAAGGTDLEPGGQLSFEHGEFVLTVVKKSSN